MPRVQLRIRQQIVRNWQQSAAVRMQQMSSLQEKIFRTKKTALITVLGAFQLACALPGWIFFVCGLHMEGKLTVTIAAYLALVCIIASAVAGFLFWITVVEPIRRNQKMEKRAPKKKGDGS